MRSRYLALFLVPLSSLLLASAPALELSAESQTVLSRLVLRDYTVTISQGAGGVERYDVYAQNGQVLDASLNVTQLQAKYPDVYGSLQPAVAGSLDRSDSLLMMESLDF